MSDAAEQRSITYTVNGLDCEGFFARPRGSGPFPGVVIAHAWMGAGDFERRQATRLAEMGYAALAADVYGAGNRADNPTDALELMQPLVDDRATLRARIAAAVAVLQGMDDVDADRVAADGILLRRTDGARVGAERPECRRCGFIPRAALP